MNKILLVEDSKEIYHQVKAALIGSYNLSWSETAKDAREFLSGNVPDLVLLDMELPDGSGLEICQLLQAKHYEVPVFFISSHDDLSKKVMSFTAGADDYILKPFDSLELKARIEAKMRKKAKTQNSALQYIWDELEVYPSRQEVYIKVKHEKKRVDLTSLEFKILLYFCERKGEVISREKMLDEIWGKDVYVYSRSVDTHVSKLRRKISEVSDVIKSVHGVGYKFEPTSSDV